MTRAARLALGLLLGIAGCSRPTPPPAPDVAAATDASGAKVCRIGPDGAPPPGTLPSPGRRPGGTERADRGIGGTGAPATRLADRGIGGTGIIGVITGFASVCVAGEEVALPEGVPTGADEGGSSPADLRAGQVVALEASGPAGSLQARRIAIRHAVIGPVERVGPGTMTVAGQMVATGGATGSAVDAKPGQWVAVSGLPENGGMIIASRIDPAPPGRVLVRGELVRIYGASRIGSLPVTLPPGFSVPGGFPVTVTGQLQNGTLIADTAARDAASESPSAYFGPGVRDFVVEGAVAVMAGGYLINHEFVSGSNLGSSGDRGRGIARFSRGAGGLVSTGLQTGGPGGGFGGGGLGGSFAPAPTVPVGGGRAGGFGGAAGGGTGGFGANGFPSTGNGQPGGFGTGGFAPAFGGTAGGGSGDGGSRPPGPGRR